MEREGRHFDRLVQQDGDFNPFADRGWQTLARRFAATVPKHGLRLLDVGCGTGQSRRVYLDHTSRYVGIDLSLDALRVASRRFGSSAWLRADACSQPFRAASFDVIAFSSVLHHLGAPGRRTALAEAAGVLRPGGWVFAFDPNLLHPAMLLFRHPRSPLYSSRGVSPDERPLLPSTLRQDLSAAGFVDVGQRAQSDLPYRKVALPTLDRLLPLYNRVDRLWQQLGLGRWFGAFVISWGRKP